MFDQYLELGGTEIANAARVAAYVDKNAPHIPIPARARDRLGNSTIAEAVGDAVYESPIVDNAPWLDPTEPSTGQFYGVWPLAVQGISDSTLQATSIESVGTGGSVGAQRFASRAIRVRALLVAENMLALESGQSWLEAALKSNECTDHGGACGGASLCFFAAEPNVCRMYEPSYQAGFTMPVAATPETSPLILREPGIDAIWNANLLMASTAPRDGTIVSWGTVSDQNTTEVLESYGPVVLQRTNHVPNPRFAENLDTWDAPSALTARHAVGGMDGGSFARVHHLETDVNPIEDPMLSEHTPEELGWENRFGATVFPNPIERIETLTPAPDAGPIVAQVAAAAVPHVVGADTFWAAVTIPIPASPAGVTNGGVVALVRVTESTGATVGVEVLNPAGVRQSYSAAGGLTPGWWVRLNHNDVDIPAGEEGWQLRIIWKSATPQTGALQVIGPTVCNAPTFNPIAGSLEPGAFGLDYSYAFATPGDSRSPSVQFDPASTPTIGTPVMNVAGDYTASFDLRAEVDQMIQVVAYNGDFDQLEVLEFMASPQWTRYSFSGVGPGTLQIYFESDRPFDLGRSMVEGGSLPMPYMDGSTPWEEAAAGYIVKPSKMETPQYETEWTGQPHASVSRLTWLGQMTVGGPFGHTGTLDGTCNSFAFITVHQGSIAGRAQYALRFAITAAQQVAPYERTMHEVTCIEGPKIIENVPLGDSGGAMRIVDFTLVAGKPFAYSNTEELLFPTRMSELSTSAWPGVDSCEVTELTPIVDPDCITPPSPPRVPTIPASCIMTEPELQRYWIDVPAASVSLWKQTVTRIIIQSGSQAIRQVRVRAFPNPFNRVTNTWSRTNLVPNPRAVSPGNIWTSAPGTGGVAPIVYDPDEDFFGEGGIPADVTTAAKMTWTTAPTAGIAALGMATGNVIIPGRTYFGSIWGGFRRSLPVVLGAQLCVRVSWYTAADALISSETGDIVIADGVDWIKKSEVEAIAPATAAKARVFIEYVGGDSIRPQLNDTLWATGALLQLVPIDGEVVLTKTAGDTAEPVYRVDFDNLPADHLLWNAVVTTDLNNNTVMQFSTTAVTSGAFSFLAPGVLVPGKAYALVLDGVFPDGTPDTAAVISIVGEGETTSPAYTPGDPSRDTVGGVGIQPDGYFDAAFTVTFSSPGTDVFRVYGMAVYEVQYSEAYFDGTLPDSGGEYFYWSGTANASSSIAAAGLAVDPCSWCSEFVISYLPPNTELVVDAILERAFANVSGQGEQAADTLLYASDGGPMTWTSLTCGIPYLIAVDVPEPLLNDVTISVEAAKAG